MLKKIYTNNNKNWTKNRSNDSCNNRKFTSNLNKDNICLKYSSNGLNLTRQKNKLFLFIYHIKRHK